MTQIAPRWEFRIFEEKMDEIESKFRKLSKIEKTQESSEVYLVSSSNKDHNVKIRDSQLDIKKLINEKSGFEKWEPVLKNDFPISADIITSDFFPALKAELPDLKRDTYTFQQFLDELIIRHPEIYIIQVSKRRFSFTINDCPAELADVVFNNAAMKTACIESSNREKLTETQALLNLENYKNVNYIKAIKNIMNIKKL